MTVTVAKKYRKALARKLRTTKQRKTGIKLAVRVTVTDTAGLQTAGTLRVSVKG